MRYTTIAVLLLSLAAPAAAQTHHDPAAALQEADAKQKAGDLAGALAVLKKAAESASAPAELHVRLAQVYEAHGELDLAIDTYALATAKLSGAALAEAHARRALAQELRGMQTAADESAQAAMKADATSAWARATAARHKAKDGEGDAALAMLDGTEAAGVAALEARALALEAKGDFAGAEKQYREAQPATSLGTLGLAHVLRRAGRAAESEPLVQQVLAAAPGAVEAYKESARVKLALHRPDEALGDASTAAALAEGDPEVKALVTEVAVARAMAQIARGEATFAVEDLKRLRDAEPGDPDTRVGLARALVATKQVDAALVELDAAIQAAPAHGPALFQKGLLLHTAKGDAAGAVAVLAQAVAAEPKQADYRAALGAALLDQKLFDRAVAELEKAVATPGLTRVDAWVLLGGAHLAAKRYPEAVAALDKGVALMPKSAQAQAYLAWAHFGLKDATAFKRHANEAKALGIKDPTLLDYLKRIEAGEPIK